jgi:hypothetical protein
VKTAEKAVTALVLLLLAIQVIRNGFIIDTSAIALLLILVFLVLLDSRLDITRLKVGLSGLEITREALQLEQQLSTTPDVQANANDAVSEAKVTAEDSTLAFINLWIKIEVELRRLAGKDFESKRPPSDLIAILRSRETLDPELSRSLDYLKNIRNLVVHGQLRLNDQEASTIVSLAGTVLAKLRQIREIQ